MTCDDKPKIARCARSWPAYDNEAKHPDWVWHHHRCGEVWYGPADDVCAFCEDRRRETENMMQLITDWEPQEPYQK